MELLDRVLSFYKIPSPADKPETDKERLSVSASYPFSLQRWAMESIMFADSA